MPSPLRRLPGIDCLAIQQHVAAAPDQPHHRAQCRCLARAIVSDQTDGLSFRNVKAQAPQYPCSSEGDFEVKVMSQVRCTRAALPMLRQSSAPRVININAVYGRYPDPVFMATSVNRAACLGLAKSLAMELGGEGILVNTVNIGFVTTPQWENIHRRRAPDLPADEFFGQLAAAEVPLRRFGRHLT